MKNRREGPIVIVVALALAAIDLVGQSASAAGQAPATGQAAPAPAQGQAAPPPAQAKPPDAKPSADQQDLIALTQLVDASAGKPGADIRVTWRTNHFVKSQGDSVYIPFTVTIDRAQLTGASAAVYVRAINRAQPPPAAAPAQPGAAPPAPPRPTYAWDTIYFVDLPQNGNLSRAIALTPGTYDLYVAVKERGTPAPGKMGVVKHELTVPPFGTDLSTSSVILTHGFEQLTTPLAPDKQQDNPYVFGTVRLDPSLDNAFTKTSKLQLMFWIYNASQAAGKPDMQVEFNFHLKQPDGTEKFFNKTQPQVMNEKTLPVEFDLTKGHQLYSSLVIELASFPVGEYRLEIKVTDKPSGKAVTKDVNFQVTAA